MVPNSEFELKDATLVSYPKKYKVFLLNDDYTAMEFVVEILTTLFHKSADEAEKIMLEIHKKDRGLCGIFTHEIAETKVMQVFKKAKKSGYPLKATMEEE